MPRRYWRPAGLAAAPALASSGAGACATTARTLTGTLARRRHVRDPGPGELERHPVPVQPRVRGARLGEPGAGRRRPGHRRTGCSATATPWPGSSYATTGWAIQQALPDQISTLDTFGQQVGQPSRTIAWGHSLGGIITAGLIQSYPNRFSAALPMCGVLSGGVATWNTALDSEFAFQQLIDPGRCRS